VETKYISSQKFWQDIYTTKPINTQAKINLHYTLKNKKKNTKRKCKIKK